jgi:putative heme-binding domain-containing protein
VVDDDTVSLSNLQRQVIHATVDIGRPKVESAAAAIARLKPNLSRQQAELLLRRMSQANSICKLLDPLLVQLANPAASPLPARVTDDVRSARLQFWSEWYQRKFDAPLSLAQSPEKNDRQLFDFLLSDKVKSGDRQRGGLVYERLQCQSCHGGGVTPGREGRIFGPDLSGVTRRLSATEFAESLVYPSKQVAERYKAYEISLNDGLTLTGFITEQDDSTVTLADREQVHRIGRAQIRTLAPQATSLMPEHLLNSLTWDEIKDLVAFLDENGSAIGAAR